MKKRKILAETLVEFLLLFVLSFICLSTPAQANKLDVKKQLLGSESTNNTDKDSLSFKKFLKDRGANKVIKTMVDQTDDYAWIMAKFEGDAVVSFGFYNMGSDKYILKNIAVFETDGHFSLGQDRETGILDWRTSIYLDQQDIADCSRIDDSDIKYSGCYSKEKKVITYLLPNEIDAIFTDKVSPFLQ